MQVTSNFLDRVSAELSAARQKHGPMTNTHEAYAVILEEVEEFWEMVKADRHKDGPDARTEMVDELVQIAAMCQRAVEDTMPDAISWAEDTRPGVATGDVPRRNRIDLHTPAEEAIRQAILAVEAAGAAPLLTDAVTLLQEAKSKVADFVETL